MQPVDVLTVGHALVDVLSQCDDEFIASEGLNRGAMTLVDSDRAQYLHDRMSAASEASGGSAANTGAGVVSCGSTAAFVGTVADDRLGRVFASDIKAAGVEFDTPPIDGTTGRSFIFVTPDGERTMNTDIGAAAHVSMRQIQSEVLRSSQITYVEGYLLDDRIAIDDWHNVASEIHQAGNLFSVTLSDSFCVERHRAVFTQLLEGDVDICFGNEDELKALYETPDLQSTLDRIAKQCRYVAITRGAAGSLVTDGTRWHEIPAEPVTVVDTTGAGDLYASGFLAGIAQGMPVEDAGKLASKAAGACISALGARIPSGVRITLA